MGMQVGMSDYVTRNQLIIQNQNVARSFKNINSQVMYMESNNQYLSNDNYRNQVYAVSDSDKEEKIVDLTRLFMNKDSYLKGSIAGADDVDFYSFSLNGILGKYEKSINITLEGVGNTQFDMTVYDQYGNQVGLGEKDADGNLNINITDITPDTDKYYIKIESKDAGAMLNNEYHLKIDLEDADNSSSGGNMWNKMKSVLSSMHDKASRGESYDAEISELKNIQENQKLEYEKNIREKQEEQYEKINGSVTEKYDCSEILDKVSDGKDITEKEEGYLKIFANMFSYEQAMAQGNVVKIGYEIKEIFQEAGVTDLDSIAIYRGNDGGFYVSGIEDTSIKAKVESEINAKYKEKLYQLFLSGSEELNQYSSKEYNRTVKKQQLNDYLYKISDGKVSIDDISVDANSGRIQGLPESIEEIVNNPVNNYKYKDIREKILEVKSYERQTGSQIPSVDCRYQFINGKLQIA